MGNQQERAELHKTIWKIANDLRGSVDGWEFKAYVLGSIFYRFISENICDYIHQLMKEAGQPDFDYATIDDNMAENIRQKMVEEKGYFILPSQLFQNVVKKAEKDENLNETLTNIFRSIEASAVGTPSEEDLRGLFSDFSVDSAALGTTVIKRNQLLAKVLNTVSQMELGSRYNDTSNDTFGDTYEFLMQMYASQAGKSGGEFFTPQQVSELLARLASWNNPNINKVYDPACGSGNFLTETYLCLRRLENEVLRLKVAADSKLMDGQISFGFEENGPIKVSIHQFYGIEINDFACSVAQTALWIAESQTMKETEGIIHAPMDYFPLQTYRGITEGNALRIDWSKACPANRLSYIIGNPPFVANSGRVSAKEASVKAMMTNEQKEDKKRLFGSNAGTLDYVACWFKKAAQFMNGTGVRAAFVATNSICQGEQVAPLWKPLFDDGVKVNFAHRSFKWESEASQKATVFVVIVGFSYMESPKKELFDGDFCNEVKHINAYLVDADDVFLEKRKIPISINAKKMHRGSQPTDNGNFIFSRKEYEQFICDNPDAKPLFRKFMMGKDFIDRVPRYCLWLKKASPQDIKKYPEIRGRLNQIREYRMQSTKAATRKKAETPMLFDEDQQPDTAFVAIPEVSSGNRRYIPIDFMMPDTVVGNKIRILENAELYDFGVLTSNVHMAWMRTTCGYYGPSYQYSINIVYNNFPWPSPTEEQKQRIEQTAQGILDARSLYPDSSLADLYDPLTMPVELRKAHTANDKAVMQAYGMPIKETDEAACVAWLMRLYQEMTKGDAK